MPLERTDLMTSQPAVARQLQDKYDAKARTLKDPLWPCKREGQDYPEAEWSAAAPEAE